MSTLYEALHGIGKNAVLNAQPGFCRLRPKDYMGIVPQVGWRCFDKNYAQAAAASKHGEFVAFECVCGFWHIRKKTTQDQHLVIYSDSAVQSEPQYITNEDREYEAENKYYLELYKL